MIQTKSGAAGLSIASNAILIVLKLVAGAITGSIAIITEAIHSAIDLLASVIAFFSVRAADEPADREHPYGHEKVENLAAAIEGMLILVGAGIIIFEATRRLVIGSEVEDLGIGIAVIAFSMVANIGVSTFLYRRARALESPALEGDAAHLRTDVLTSAGVLARPAARRDHRRAGVRRDRRAVRRSGDRGRGGTDPDPVGPRAGGRVAAGGRARCRWRRRSPRRAERAPEIVGYHKLRARGAGARRYIDLHLQFRSGTTLERAHDLAHAVREEIEADDPAFGGAHPHRARGVLPPSRGGGARTVSSRLARPVSR